MLIQRLMQYLGLVYPVLLSNKHFGAILPTRPVAEYDEVTVSLIDSNTLMIESSAVSFHNGDKWDTQQEQRPATIDDLTRIEKYLLKRAFKKFRKIKELESKQELKKELMSLLSI